jgi:hypothetical protein
MIDDLPKNIPHVDFFLVENTSEIPKIPELSVVTRTGGNYDLSELELEMYFWDIRHHDSGYKLAHAMQLVLDALPTTTKLRIRTSQGHLPASSFSIVEVSHHGAHKHLHLQHETLRKVRVRWPHTS